MAVNSWFTIQPARLRAAGSHTTVGLLIWERMKHPADVLESSMAVAATNGGDGPLGLFEDGRRGLAIPTAYVMDGSRPSQWGGYEGGSGMIPLLQ